jgi:hypothetical protein
MNPTHPYLDGCIDTPLVNATFHSTLMVAEAEVGVSGVRDKKSGIIFC